jgi:hypothetical protein
MFYCDRMGHKVSFHATVEEPSYCHIFGELIVDDVSAVTGEYVDNPTYGDVKFCQTSLRKSISSSLYSRNCRN